MKSHQVVSEDHTLEPAAVDQSGSLEEILVLLLLRRCVLRRRVRPDPTFVDCEKLLHDVVVIPAKHHEQCGRGRRHAKQTRVGEGVMVDPTSAVVEADAVLVCL